MLNSTLHVGVCCVFVAALLACPQVFSDEDVSFFSSTFLPTSVTITQGDSVNFNWVAGEHVVTSGDDQDDPDAGALFEADLDEDNPTFSYQFNEPGIYSFHDGLDDDITGTIFVNEFEVLVAVFDNEFFPVDITLFEGDKVKWEFDGDVLHTVTSGEDLLDPELGDLFDVTIFEPPGGQEVFEYVYEEAGYFPYICVPHATMGMVGSVTVQKKFIRGDADGNEILDIADPITILEYLFLDADESTCLDSQDLDDDGDVELDDVMALLDALFSDDVDDPPAPWPTPGPDRTEDDNLCETDE